MRKNSRVMMYGEGGSFLMDNLGTTLTVIFTLLTFWMALQIYNQLKEIKISSRFFHTNRCLILICLITCCFLLLVGFTDQSDFVLTFVMTVFMTLLMFQREGVGNRGLIKKGTFIPYKDIIRYECYKDQKLLKVIVVYKESIRKDRIENQITLNFNLTKEKEVISLLSVNLPGKQM